MLLGIPYHVALAYRVGEVWIVNTHEGVPGFAAIAEFIHLFRMPAFFIIAGYFTALLLARRAPGAWLGGRIRRLALPLAVALVTLNPLLNLACELSNFPLREAVRSWAHNSAESGGYWVRHLWFLIVLLYYSAIAAGLVALFARLAKARLPDGQDRQVARFFVPLWFALAVLLGLWEAVSIELFYMGGLATNGPQQIFRLDETLEYLPWFLLGCFLARAPVMRARFFRFSPAILMAGILFAGLSMIFKPDLWPPYGRFLSTLATMCLTQPVLVLVRGFAARPSALVQRLVDASFVIYLFHLPILAWLVVQFLPVAMPVVVKALAVLVLTVALSWGAWEIVARVPLLRLLYDGMIARGDGRFSSTSLNTEH